MYWSTTFDPRSAYHRRMWHYESGNPLSVAQLVSLGSLDPRTAALLWLLIERHSSVIVSGPTDPTPGVGKTTTLNALLGFLPAGTSLVYTTGMYEDFEFKDQVTAATTCVLCNEVSDHLPIYMWGRVARTFLRLPEDGFAIATSCHADTVTDVLALLAKDLRLPGEVIGRLGVVVNIGLVGRLWPPRRRFLTVNLNLPATDAACSAAMPTHFGANLLPLATWDAASDDFIPATSQALDELARLLGMTSAELVITLERRTALIASLSEGRGAGPRAMRDAIETFTEAEQEAAGGERQSERGEAFDDQ
jgi:hypothetical protein